jgi:TonB-linked SusC/RagA family outer membrane protein
MEWHPIYGESWNKTPAIPIWAANTDWYDEMTDPSGIINHNLTFSGGTKNARFYAGFGVIKQDGIILYTHNKKQTARLNSDFNLLKGRVKVGESMALSYMDNLSVPNLNENSPVQQGPYRSQSIIPVRWTGNDYAGYSHTFIEGDWGGTGIAPRLGSAPNVVANLTRNKDDYLRGLAMAGNIYLDIMITEGLRLKSNLGGTRQKEYARDKTVPAYEETTNTQISTLFQDTSYKSSWVWTNTLTFDRQFGSHGISAVAGYEVAGYDIGRLLTFLETAIPNPPFSLSSSDTSKFTETRLLSEFIKADYSFGSKYFVSATIRRDGCSRFSESGRYGVFPSFSAGWKISNESFMSGVKWISDLKIRGSWGQTGNQFALSPQYSVYQFGESIGGSWYDLYGTFNSAVLGYYPTRIGNPDARWESASITDIGLDAGFFDSKINISLDWYSKKASDLLYNPPQPGTAGAGDPPYINIAAMKNSGIDLELTYKNKWDNLGFEANIIFTSCKNKIVTIEDLTDYFASGYSVIGTLVRNAEGHPLSSYYGYRVIGLFKNENDVNKSAIQDGAAPGFFKFDNIDTISSSYTWPEQVINNLDETFIGNPNPDFTYGIDLSLSWKNIDISGFIYGSKGNDIFNYNKWWTDFWPSWQGQKSKALLYESWTTTNQEATVPKATNLSNFSTNTQVCSYYIEDGSYLRLKNLQLGYTLPERIVKKLEVKSLRIFLQGVNLFTITRYSGLDPELGGSDLAFGIDYGNYPNVKQLIFGVNLTL